MPFCNNSDILGVYVCKYNTYITEILMFFDITIIQYHQWHKQKEQGTKSKSPGPRIAYPSCTPNRGISYLSKSNLECRKFCDCAIIVHVELLDTVAWYESSPRLLKNFWLSHWSPTPSLQPERVPTWLGDYYILLQLKLSTCHWTATSLTTRVWSEKQRPPIASSCQLSLAWKRFQIVQQCSRGPTVWR